MGPTQSHFKRFLEEGGRIVRERRRRVENRSSAQRVREIYKCYPAGFDVEEGHKPRGMQANFRSWKRQGHGFSHSPPKDHRLAQHLNFRTSDLHNCKIRMRGLLATKFVGICYSSNRKVIHPLPASLPTRGVHVTQCSETLPNPGPGCRSDLTPHLSPPCFV